MWVNIMLLTIIYEKLKERGIRDFVFEADIIDRLPFKNEVIHAIRDVRSATFYACGLAQKQNASVALFIRKEYLPNTYTGLTEAWFQNRNIVVVAFGADILNDDLGYFKSCTYSRLKIQTEVDTVRYLENVQRSNLPELYLVEDSVTYEEPIWNTCPIDLNCLSSVPDKLFLYERVSGLFREHPNIVRIAERDKYGTISKYMGFCVASEKRNLLVIDDSLIYLDANIFNNRYINEKFKILVIGEMKHPNVLRWLEANHISCFEEREPLRAINILMETKKPTIAFVSIKTQENNVDEIGPR